MEALRCVVSSKYVVGSGECISSIAFKHGFFPGTLWDDPGNAALKELRGNGNTLVPGDVVAVPDKRQKAENAATGATYTFQRRGVPDRLRLQLLRDGAPRAGEAFILVVDGISHPGMTDGEGRIEQWLLPDAKSCELRLANGEECHTIELRALGPADLPAGQEARLKNLGFLGSGADDNADAFTAALSAFQRANGLNPSGLADALTVNALVAKHGS